MMQVSTSAYYDWLRRDDKHPDSQTWHLKQRMKTLFNESRQSLGSRQLMTLLRKEGFIIGRYRVRSLMKALGLSVWKKKRFVLTTDIYRRSPGVKA
ncbi:hypothetical protein GCM10011297_35340 [Bacterioplanes sanyensis]|nr:hypothetical protein GCM10011297_35340 [Bacterioplanes sanyensis]